jgi:lipopolysaccharide/colanic/teichoic acid biosynthesis glycosyltransferase
MECHNSLASKLDHKEQRAKAVLSPNWGSLVQLTIKRTMDVVGSAMLLILLSPLFLILAILVRISSSGPIFYRWRVVGRNERPFISYKFRSMYKNADEMKAKLAHLNEMSGPVFKITDDPRITPLGKWLRRYSLDELPQLYSVIKGDMSLVGPRPPLLSEYACFTEYQKQKLSVKPGMTCLWQISGRNDIADFDRWLKLDLEYIQRWNPKLDLWILLRTANEVFSGSGK